MVSILSIETSLTKRGLGQPEHVKDVGSILTTEGCLDGGRYSTIVPSQIGDKGWGIASSPKVDFALF